MTASDYTISYMTKMATGYTIKWHNKANFTPGDILELTLLTADVIDYDKFLKKCSREKGMFPTVSEWQDAFSRANAAAS